MSELKPMRNIRPCLRVLLFGLGIGVLTPVLGIEKRDRWSGLYNTSSSSVMGRNNLFISMYGRGFLWDNGGNKAPTLFPHMELGYGLWDILDVFGGLQIMTTRPSQLYVRVKATTPNNKNIRFVGLSQSVELNSNLSKEFKSNGYRFRNEGFSPDHFKFGGSGFLSSYKFVTAVDVEFIKISTWLPFKAYLNLGYEAPVDSWMENNKKDAVENYRLRHGYAADEDFDFLGTTDFTKIPTMLGLELKTHSTDFFVELESEFFYQSLKQFFQGEGSEKYWARYNVVVEGAGGNNLKVFDMHILENPLYVNLGGKLKYPTGLSLLGGFSWILSREYGGTLGGCDRDNVCHGEPTKGPRDGYSPFYPQWKVFGGIKYPFRFHQTSAELYRTYLLRKNRKNRKVIDIDENLNSGTGEAP